MTGGFRPTLLLSMPQMQDPNFARTVVLLCDYLPEGAFGLVLNRPTDLAASDMVRLEPPVTRGNRLPLFLGGPVQPERGWILIQLPNQAGDDALTLFEQREQQVFRLDFRMPFAIGELLRAEHRFLCLLGVLIDIHDRESSFSNAS